MTRRRQQPAAPPAPAVFRRPEQPAPVTRASATEPPAPDVVEMAGRLDACLARFTFTHPVELADLAAVQAAIAVAIGADFSIEMYHIIRIACVVIYRRGQTWPHRLVERELPVLGAPTASGR